MSRPWTVTPHGPIEKLEDNLWAVEGGIPKVPGRRRMAIVKRSDGTLVFFHALPLADSALAEVTAWGQPAVLIVPHDQHGVDATPFAARLGLKIYGPKLNEAKLRARFALAGTTDQLPPDPAVSFESIAGTQKGECVGIVRSGDRVSLLFADVYQHHGDALPFVFRLLGLRGGPKVTALFKLFFTSDKAALRTHLEQLAALPALARIVPCHGEIVTTAPATVLKQVAAAI